MNEFTLLILNFLLYFLTFLYTFKRNKNLSPYNFIWLLWTICAFMGILYYYSDECYDYYKKGLTILPFVFIYICLIISTKPFKKAETKLIDFKHHKFLEFYKFLIAIAAILPFIEIVIHISKGVNWAIIMEAKNDLEMRQYYNARWFLSWFGARCLSVCTLNHLLTPILIFHSLIVKKTNKYILTGLILAEINCILINFLQGGRYIAIQSGIIYCYLFFFFKNYLSCQTIKYVKLFSIGLLSILLSFITTITIMRYGETSDYANRTVLGSLYQYSGESMINFNQDMWYENTDISKNFSYRNFSEKVFGSKPQEINMTSRNYVYYTIFGELYLQFYLFLIPILLFISIFLTYKIGCKKYLKLDSVIIIALYSYFITNGIFYNIYKNYWIELIITIIFAIIVKQLRYPINIARQQ